MFSMVCTSTSGGAKSAPETHIDRMSWEGLSDRLRATFVVEVMDKSWGVKNKERASQRIEVSASAMAGIRARRCNYRLIDGIDH